jgi:hypothetical protein
MQVDARPGELIVQVGPRFGGPEAARLLEAMKAFAPLSRVTLDFTGVEVLEEKSVVSLARALASLRNSRVHLRGLGVTQRRLFVSLGVEKALIRPGRDRFSPGRQTNAVTPEPRVSLGERTPPGRVTPHPATSRTLGSRELERLDEGPSPRTASGPASHPTRGGFFGV